jgi:hypothetical protein
MNRRAGQVEPFAFFDHPAAMDLCFWALGSTFSTIQGSPKKPKGTIIIHYLGFFSADPVLRSRIQMMQLRNTDKNSPQPCYTFFLLEKIFYSR